MARGERTRTRNSWSSLRRRVTLALVGAGMLLTAGVAGPATAAEITDHQPGVQRKSTAAADPVFGAGQAIKLPVWVINNSGKTCRLSQYGDGVLSITAMTRDGVRVQPSLTVATYLDGLGAVVAANLRPVANNGYTTLAVTSTPDGGTAGKQALTAVSWSPSERNVLSRWVVDGPGKYTVSVSYAVPAVPGLPADVCQGASNVRTIAFTVQSAPAGTPAVLSIAPWPPIGPAALILAAAIAAGWLLSRRSRDHRRWPAARTGHSPVARILVVTVLASVAVVGGVSPAQASLGLTTGAAADPAFKKHFDGCIAAFKTSDPRSIVPFLNQVGFDIRVQSVVGKGSEISANKPVDASNGTGTGSLISWNPDYTGDVGGVASEKCSSLYHELFHAYEYAKGITDYSNCNAGNNIFTGEVHATFAENEYRAAHNLGPRKTYSKIPLPKAEKECRSHPAGSRIPPPAVGQLDGGCAGASCANATGDPHLGTFDQRAYDFQAVGEFAATKSTKDSFAVQVRQTAFPGFTDVSIDQAVAMNVAGAKVSFSAESVGMVARLNGTPFAAGKGTTNLPGGGVVDRGDTPLGPAFMVTWPDGTKAWVSSTGVWGLKLEIKPAPARRGTLVGLFGNFDGDRTNDFVTRQGAPITSPDFTQLYKVYGESWRLTQAESLFTYAAGQTTDTFTNKNLPTRAVTVADLADRESAAAICRNAGTTQQPYLDDCTLDLALTGRADFADSAGYAESFATPTPPPLTHDGSTLSGSLKAGEQRLIPLDLGDATVFRLVDVVGGEAGVTFKPVGPTSEESPGFAFTDPYLFRVVASGTYQLSVTSEDAADYRFRIVTHKERRHGITSGDKVGAGGLPGTGKLDDPGRVDLYSFAATANGQVVLVGGKPCSVTVSLAVDDGPRPHAYAPDEACTDIPIGRVEAGKRYLLAVWSDDAKTLDYSFQFTLS